jgi:hypothetical protein
MIKIQAYKSDDGHIFEKVDDCLQYELGALFEHVRDEMSKSDKLMLAQSIIDRLSDLGFTRSAKEECSD